MGKTFWQSSEQNKGQISLGLLVCRFPRKFKVACSCGEKNNVCSFVKWSQFLAQVITHIFHLRESPVAQIRGVKKKKKNLIMQDIQQPRPNH